MPETIGADDELDLGAEDVCTSLIYWADVLYERPDPDAAAHESTDELEALRSDLNSIGETIRLEQAKDPALLARLTTRLVFQDSTLGEPLEPVPPSSEHKREQDYQCLSGNAT